MIENKLVFETDVAKWYTNSFTESLTNYLHNDDRNIKPIVFTNYIAYMVELNEDKSREYVVVDNKLGQVVYSSQSFEAVCYWIDAIRLNKVMK